MFLRGREPEYVYREIGYTDLRGYIWSVDDEPILLEKMGFDTDREIFHFDDDYRAVRTYFQEREDGTDGAPRRGHPEIGFWQDPLGRRRKREERNRARMVHPTANTPRHNRHHDGEEAG